MPTNRQKPKLPIAAQYLSDRDLATRYRVHVATVWRWTECGILPKPVKISSGCTRWRIDEIEQRDATFADARAVG